MTARSAVAQRSLTARGGAPSRPMPNSLRGAPASSQRTQATGRPFYGRQFEKEQLDRELKQDPCEILLLLGPPNCGKSALLDDFCKGKRHVVYLDCRNMSASDPNAFITALLKQLMPKAPHNLQLRLAGLAREVLSGTTVAVTMGFGLGQPDADATLNKVFATLKCATLTASMLRRPLHNMRHAPYTCPCFLLRAAAVRSLMSGRRRLSRTLQAPTGQCWLLMRPMRSCHGQTRTQKSCATCCSTL